MSTVVVSPSNVSSFPEGGGHIWVYLQYVKGLQALGCDVYWLERFTSTGDPARDDGMLRTFNERMTSFGLKEKSIVYALEDSDTSNGGPVPRFIGATASFAESIFRRADLLLNFYYAMPRAILSQFKRSALVDIDPGLLQFWIGNNQLTVPKHDYYLTIGETVGTPSARFPDCGLSWIHIRPPVSLESWPYRFDPDCRAFSTISTWWGDEWITDGKNVLYENNKRLTFLEYIELPRATPQELELALNFGETSDEGNTEPGLDHDEALGRIDPVDQHSYGRGDSVQRKILLSHGWRLRHSYEVANTPFAYQAYIQGSRGEFSCVKPSCLRFQNAWISDRTICYLASGKPAVVQNTGPSNFLPHGEGMFRFSSMDEAAHAFATINANYRNHCEAARNIAETYFDAKKITAQILEQCDV